MNLLLLNPNRLSDIIELAAKQSAISLQEIINQPVSLSFSKVKILKIEQEKDKAEAFIEDPGVVINLEFQGGINGLAYLFLGNGQDKARVINLFEDFIHVTHFEEPLEVIFYEIGNVMLNAYVGTIANQLGEKVEYTVPQVFSDDHKNGWKNDSIPINLADQQQLFLRSTLGVGEMEINVHIVILVNYSKEVAQKLC